MSGRRPVPLPRKPSRDWVSWQLLALLGFALLAPASLPAGGGERRLPEVRRRDSRREPLLSVGGESLRCAPRQEAPALAHLEPGMPLRVLRHWFPSSGSRWLQVETVVGAGEPARGWLQG